MSDDKPVYWDPERQSLYWIEWEETGNNDIPHRHYIATGKPLDELVKRIRILESFFRDQGYSL